MGYLMEKEEKEGEEGWRERIEELRYLQKNESKI